MKHLGALIFLVSVLPAHSQNWRVVGAGLDNDVRVFYPDTIQNVLYGGGSFWSSGSEVMNGISTWNHMQWDSLAGGTTQCSSPGCNPVVALEKYNGEIYAGGFFTGMQNVTGTCGIAKWTGSNWVSVGSCNGVVFDFAHYGGDLYAVGNFDSIGGIQAYSIAKYDGIAWYAVADTVFKNNSLSSVIAFQNELYVGGTFHVPSLSINCIARYYGLLWNSVGGFFTGGCGINTMELYQNNLIVGGYFTPAMGGPAEGIAQWDGTYWSDVGGGLKDTLGFPANVFAFCIHQNKLYAGGTFRYAGGAYASNIAQWDGNQWCSSGSQLSSGVGALASFDDTLYVGGGFWDIDGNNSLQYVAQWIGGSFSDTCGNSTSIQDQELENSSVMTSPNPSNTSTAFQFSGTPTSRTIIITDNLGREIRREESSESQHTISVASFAEGIYFYSIIEDGEMKANGKFVVVH